MLRQRVACFGLLLAACGSPHGNAPAASNPQPTPQATSPTPSASAAASTAPSQTAAPPTPPKLEWILDCNLGVKAACERLAPAPSEAQLRRCERGGVSDCAAAGLALSLRHDDAPAARLLKRACDARQAAGCGGLAVLTAQGRGGIPADQARAIALHQRACATAPGYAASCYTLGRLAANSKPPDIEQSWTSHSRACELGFADGCAALAYLIGSGLKGDADLPRAREMYKAACDQGSGLGCYGLALHYETERKVTRFAERAMLLLTLACERAEPLGCLALGSRYLRDGDLPNALRFRRAACVLGSTGECLQLGATYEQGLDGVAQDHTAAEELYGLACDQGLSAACAMRDRVKGEP